MVGYSCEGSQSAGMKEVEGGGEGRGLSWVRGKVVWLGGWVKGEARLGKG